MARHLLLVHNQVTTPQAVGLAIGLLCLCALTLFMCAGHSSRRWRKWRAYCGHGRSDDPVIQLNPESILEYHVGHTDPSTHSGDGTLWKKNILMGGKCQLPDFSGVIMYDSEGNVIAPSKRPLALPWK